MGGIGFRPMEAGNSIWFLLSALSALCGMGLALVQVDPDELYDQRHCMPGMSLFRFPVWRWFSVFLCGLVCLIFLAAGFGLSAV